VPSAFTARLSRAMLATATGVSRGHARVARRSPIARAQSRSLVARARARDEGEASFSLVPRDATDGLSRYRAVLAPLFLAGGLLHLPDCFGAGPISSACGVASFDALDAPVRALTLLWALGGPAAAFGLATASFVGDVGVVVIASTEIVLGIDFPNVIAPAEIPAPIVAAQVVNLSSLVALRGWETVEKRNG